MPNQRVHHLLNDESVGAGSERPMNRPAAAIITPTKAKAKARRRRRRRSAKSSTAVPIPGDGGHETGMDHAAVESMASLSAMLALERGAYARRDYLGCLRRDNVLESDSSGDDMSCVTLHPDDDGYDPLLCPPSGTVVVSPDDRTRIVDWCYGVVDECGLSRDNVAVAADLVDRYVAAGGPSDPCLRCRVRYQLAAVTALYVSVKLHERTAVGSDAFSALSRGAYSPRDIEECELDMLFRLRWRIHPPTAVQVGRRLLGLLLPPSSCSSPAAAVERSVLEDEAAYQLECSVRDYALAAERPGTVAVAAVLNVLRGATDDAVRDGAVWRLAALLKGMDFGSMRAIASAKERLSRLVED